MKKAVELRVWTLSAALFDASTKKKPLSKKETCSKRVNCITSSIIAIIALSCTACTTCTNVPVHVADRNDARLPLLGGFNRSVSQQRAHRLPR